MDIDVDIDTAEFNRFLVRLHRDQLPFATSVAINRTAKDFQEAQREHIHDVFTVRRKRWVDRSVKIKPFATKRRLMAKVGIHPPGGDERADILTKFESGGIKRPQGGRSLAVPDEVKRTKTGFIGKRQRPKAFDFELWGRGPEATVYRGRRRAFMIRYPDGEGFIFRRTGRGAGSRMRLLYTFTPQARIDPLLEFFETAEEIIQSRFDENFADAFAHAMDTAR